MCSWRRCRSSPDWTTEYGWRKCEARPNALPQFTTQIDGVDIHFIHVTSPHENALPLIMTHGWPGSVVELLETVGPLTDPTTHGGRAEEAFHLGLPSLPGYGFSSEPTEVGWDPGRTARARAELMGRLGYTRYVAQGAIWAPSSVTRWAARRLTGCSASTGGTAIYNSSFRPFQSPVPSLFVRYGVIGDRKFFLDSQEWRNLWGRRFGESGVHASC